MMILVSYFRGFNEENGAFLCVTSEIEAVKEDIGDSMERLPPTEAKHVAWTFERPCYWESGGIMPRRYAHGLKAVIEDAWRF